MEDLAAAVQSILNDPQSMAQLQSVMNSLGMNPPQAPAPATPPVQQKPAALRPLLGEARQKKLDEASKILKLLHLLPLLKESGVLQNIL